MPVACQSRAGTEPAGETQSLLLRQSKTTEMKCFGGFFYSRKEETVPSFPVIGMASIPTDRTIRFSRNILPACGCFPAAGTGQFWSVHPSHSHHSHWLVNRREQRKQSNTNQTDKCQGDQSGGRYGNQDNGQEYNGKQNFCDTPGSLNGEPKQFSAYKYQ